MSTHNIGFFAKSIFQLSSNTHTISSSALSTVLLFKQLEHIFNYIYIITLNPVRAGYNKMLVQSVRLKI